jgi:hypothetical protein
VGFRLNDLFKLTLVFDRSPRNGLFVSLASEYEAETPTQKLAAGALDPRPFLFTGAYPTRNHKHLCERSHEVNINRNTIRADGSRHIAFVRIVSGKEE